MITEDKLEEALAFLIQGKFTLTENKTWFDCDSIKCEECPLFRDYKCKTTFIEYLNQNHEEFFV